MAEAEINGVRLYYEEQGEGTPILCIHGSGSSALMWEHAAGQLAKYGRVITYDRRGNTRSQRPDPYDSTTVAEHAADAAALLDELDAGPAIAIGRSYGGEVATALALRAPEKLCALVLLEGASVELDPAGAAWMTTLRVRAGELAARGEVDAIGETLIDAVLGEDAWLEFPDEVQEMWTANSQAILAELQPDETKPGVKELATISCPALLVAASDSPPEFRAATDKLASAMPGARTVLVRGGHMVDPAAPKVMAFVKEMARRSGDPAKAARA